MARIPKRRKLCAGRARQRLRCLSTLRGGLQETSGTSHRTKAAKKQKKNAVRNPESKTTHASGDAPWGPRPTRREQCDGQNQCTKHTVATHPYPTQWRPRLRSREHCSARALSAPAKPLWKPKTTRRIENTARQDSAATQKEENERGGGGEGEK